MPHYRVFRRHPPFPLVRVDGARHPLAGLGQPLPWTTVVIVLVVGARWSAEQITALLGALVPVLALLRAERSGIPRRA